MKTGLYDQGENYGAWGGRIADVVLGLKEVPYSKETSDEWCEQLDWRCAWNEAQRRSYSSDAPLPDDVQHSIDEVLAFAAGENDESQWLCLFSTSIPGQEFGIMRAGCDYTGWDCQAWGEIHYTSTWDTMRRLELTDEERQRLGVSL